MSRIAAPPCDNAPEAAKAALDAGYEQLGFVPKMFRFILGSPRVLAGFSSFRDTLGKASDAKTREPIALVVAQINRGVRP